MSILDGPGNATPTVSAPAANPLDQPSAAAQQVASGGGFLNELGVDWNAVDVNNEPGNGTHHCLLTKSEIRTKKDNTKSWVFTYRVTEGPDEGKTKQDWRPLPVTANGKFVDDKSANYARFLKQRLLQLGVPEDRVGSVTPADLQGIDCYITIATKDGYKNITNVVLASEVPTGAISQTMSQPANGVQGLI